jgi:hypothetical protein
MLASGLLNFHLLCIEIGIINQVGIIPICFLLKGV